MDQLQVQSQLMDLPPTFLRPGPPFNQYIDALAAALTFFCQSVDGLQSQTNFLKAIGGWLDIWGELAGIGRRANESDGVYMARIQETLLAWRDSVVAIQTWIQTVENVTVSITENLPSWGYNIIFPPTLTLAQITAILTNLKYVRPAGMPFQALLQQGGLFLNTVNYFGGPPGSNPPLSQVTGAYLAASSVSLALSIPSSTNNALSLLPNLLFTDPTLNPSLG